MTVVVTHTTPADGTFSATGAAAWNADHALVGVGTMAEQDANNVAVTGGSINNTVIGNTTPNAATFTTLTATGQTSLGGAAGAEGLRVVTTASGVNWMQISGSNSTGFSNLIGAEGSSSNIQMLYYTKGTNNHVFRTNGVGGPTQAVVSHTASAVNFVQVTGAATGGAVTISAQGSDTNTGILYFSKGFGGHQFRGYGGGNIFGQFFANQASPVNYIEFGASSSGNAVLVRVAGSDTNIDLALTPKGTGNVRFGTYTANMALTIQGYVEIKDSGGTIRRLAVIA